MVFSGLASRQVTSKFFLGKDITTVASKHTAVHYIDRGIGLKPGKWLLLRPD